MAHRDGFPRFSALSVGRGDAGHRKVCATLSESLGTPPPVAYAVYGRASKSLVDALHRRRHFFYPTSRIRGLYGSLSPILGNSFSTSDSTSWAASLLGKRVRIEVWLRMLSRTIESRRTKP